MVVTLLSNAGNVLKGELTYEMLHAMIEKINSDLNNAIQHEKDELIKLFTICEEKGISAEKAIIKHTQRITSYTNTAMFYVQQTSR